VSTELPSLKYQNTFLSGDALFAFPPSFAQGASQSIETANGILENIINSNSIYKDKISKILLVNKRSKLNHFAFHLTNPIIILIRNPNNVSQDLIASGWYKSKYHKKYTYNSCIVWSCKRLVTPVCRDSS